jgi:hypothetical protein
LFDSININTDSPVASGIFCKIAVDIADRKLSRNKLDSIGDNEGFFKRRDNNQAMFLDSLREVEFFEGKVFDRGENLNSKKITLACVYLST